jgi:UDP-N-acetylglucosamine 1-carboxyvinyltransferase
MATLHDALYITGGKPLLGEIHVHTAKNSTLYLMLGALLTPEPVVLKDIPKLSDVLVLQEMLEHFGAKTSWQDRDLHIDASELFSCEAPYALVSKMRASFVAMGALLGRCGEARISMPGGCAFGPRPVDRHIRAFKQLGVELSEEGGDFYARRGAPLRGTASFEAPTVGGTQNVILASVLGEGRVTIENAALEPEIADLADMLNGMGARISGAGTSTIRISGVPSLRGTTYRPIPDRIEAGTFMMAVAATRGRATLRGVNASHLRTVIAKLLDTGVNVLEIDNTTLLIDARGALRPTDVTAVEYPGFPTDLQAPFGAFLATIPGRSTVSDNVYPDRFTHVPELAHTGVSLTLSEDVLTIEGGPMTGARMHAADIRAGGALIVAALAASGESVVTGVQFIARGYENVVERFNQLGARMRRERVSELATGTFGD